MHLHIGRSRFLHDLKFRSNRRQINTGPLPSEGCDFGDANFDFRQSSTNIIVHVQQAPLTFYGFERGGSRARRSFSYDVSTISSADVSLFYLQYPPKHVTTHS